MRLAVSCLLLFVPLGCESTNPAYCDQDTLCVDAQRNFCDLSGVYQDISRTCIARPEEACDLSSNCSLSSAPICGDVERTNAAGQPALVRECRPCANGAPGDAECTERDASEPVCVAGACAGCRVSSDCGDPDRPVCNEMTNACLGCVRNGDCDSDVCEVEAGTCTPTAAVVYVDGSGTDGGTCGTITTPCRTIMQPQGALAKVNPARKTLRLRGLLPFAESVEIAGLDVSFVGPAIINPALDNQAVLLVSGASDVTLSEITLTGATTGADADGIRCTGASTIAFMQGEVRGNANVGIQSDSCSLRIQRSLISQNNQGGLMLSNSSFDIANNFIVSNGTAGAVDASAVGGLAVTSAAASDIFEFNTVADSRVANVGVDGAGARCTNAPITARNNIVFLRTGGTSLVSNCAFTYSDIEGGGAGTGNIDIDPLFVNPAQANFRLQPNSPARDVGDPASTVRIDFDGDARPQNGRADMGADEVVQ